MTRSTIRTGNDFTGPGAEGIPEANDTPDINEETQDEQVTDTPNQEAETQNDTVEQDNSQPKTVEELQAELQNWQSRYENANQLIGRHSQELNELRQLKQQQEQEKPLTEEEKKENEQKFLDDFVKNPKEALERELQQREQASLIQKQQQEQFRNGNKDYVYNAVPQMDTLKNTILELAREDGIENATLQQLEDTIATDPLLAVSYAKRAVLKQELDNARNQGKQVVQKIAQNSKRAPVLKGGQSQTSKRDMTSSDIRNMSNEDLKARLKELGMS